MRTRKPPKVSVYQRANGSWSVRWRPEGRDGPRKEERGYATQEDAEERAVAVRRLLRNPLAPVRETRVTVGDVLREWWDGYANTPEVKAGTRDLYARCLDQILATEIREHDADEITTAAVNRWTAALAPATNPHLLRNMLTVLSGAYRHGVDHGLVPTNPVLGARRPKTTRTTVVIPTEEQFVRLAMAAPGSGQRWRAMLLVAGYCGLRQQEVFALRRDAIEGDCIVVREAVSGADRVVGAVKTERGFRRVPLPGFVRGVLDEYIAEARIGPEALLWPTQFGGTYTASTFGKTWWRPWREAAGVPVQWRHLRHFYASVLAAAGASLLQCSRWMGHEKFAFTMDTYGFLFDADTPGVLSRIEERVERMGQERDRRPGEEAPALGDETRLEA